VLENLLNAQECKEPKSNVLLLVKRESKDQQYHLSRGEREKRGIYVYEWWRRGRPEEEEEEEDRRDESREGRNENKNKKNIKEKK
jgi:hypothetical protein